MQTHTLHQPLSSVENSSSWIRIYKFVCAAFAIIGAIFCIYFLIELFIGLAHLHASIYFAISIAVFIFETAIFYLQFKAIHNGDHNLQKQVVQLSVANLIILPVWELFGGLFLLNFHQTAIGSAIAGLIVAGIFLWLNVMVKKAFEGKAGLGIHRSDLNV